jgi:GxxExxY protein
VEIDQVTGAILDSAFKVHSALGPGLLEGVYEKCLAHELSKLNLKVERQVCLPVVYDGIVIEGSYRIDLLLEDTVIVELKVSEGHLTDLHKAKRLVNNFHLSVSAASPAV